MSWISPAKHDADIRRETDRRLGPGYAARMLAGLDAPGDAASSEALLAWAQEVSRRMETCIGEEDRIAIREACACIKSNRYSAYNKKYFPALRAEHPDDDAAYLAAVAAFMNGRGRCGKKVELAGGQRIRSYFQFGGRCVCDAVRGAWERPPSTTWCRCCQGTVKSVYQFVFADRECFVDIVETFATGGTDCVFDTWFGERTERPANAGKG